MDWKEEFLREIKTIAQKKEIEGHKAFLFWYIKATEDLDDEYILEKVIVDSPRDGGIDAVIISQKEKIVKIIQSKFSTQIGEEQYNSEEILKLKRLNEALNDSNKYDDFCKSINHRLKYVLDEAITLIKNEGYRASLVFLTTKKERPNMNEEGIKILSSKQIRGLFEDWVRGHVPTLGKICFPYIGLLEGPQNPKAYIIHVNTSIIKKIYMEWKEKLFSRNVRIFYGSTKKANVAMKKTLIEKPEYFWYFNNGISILSQKIEINQETKEMYLEDPQVINGCQTVSVIGEAKESPSTLLIKVIEIGDENKNQEFIDGVIEANNRQTPIDERILKSNHPIQVRLSRELLEFGFYYERKEKQFKEEREKNPNLKFLRRIDNKRLLQANLCIVEQPHLALAEESQLFTTHYSQVFKNEKTSVEYLLPFLVYKELEDIIKEYYGEKRKRFNQLAIFHVEKFVYENCQELRNIKKMRELCDGFIKKKITLKRGVIREIFDRVYNIYKNSEYYEIERGARDFLKLKKTYGEICEKIPKYIKEELERVIEER